MEVCCGREREGWREGGRERERERLEEGEGERRDGEMRQECIAEKIF